MAVGDTDVGAGCTITFDGGYFTDQVESFEWSGVSRGSIETTHMGTTGGDTFIPTDTYDPGTLSVTYQFDETSAPPVEAADVPATCRVTFPGANFYEASAFMTNFSVSAATKEKSMCTAELKFTSDITF